MKNVNEILRLNIMTTLMKNKINWNNTISNMWGQSNEKVLELTEQHVVPQFNHVMLIIQK